MRFKRDKLPEIDVRKGRGLAYLLGSQLYEKKTSQSEDGTAQLAVAMRPRFVRAFEWMVGDGIVRTEREILVASIKRVTVGNAIYYNHDMVAMAVAPDALDTPTPDVRVLPYWDFQTMYDPADPNMPQQLTGAGEQEAEAQSGAALEGLLRLAYPELLN